MNYPNEEYESYADCDDEFVRRSLPPGLQPFWTVDNISEATNTYSINTEDYEDGLGISILYANTNSIIIDSHYVSVFLFTGQLVSDCLLPCVRTSADVQELTTSNFNGSSVFGLSFNDKVRVRMTTMDRFYFMDSLNFFGSNLGLWPGMGLYQILEWIVGIFIARKVFIATKIFPPWKRV